MFFSALLLYAHVLLGVVTLLCVGVIAARVWIGSATALWSERMYSLLSGLAVMTLGSGALLVVLSPTQTGMGTCGGVALYVGVVALGMVVLRRGTDALVLPRTPVALYSSVGLFTMVTMLGY
ncbi:MAG: hypothetical protein KBE09_01490 [Candidatus Pacebacteria bacterium]|nr:hypothetical protein [Candidatus Paceibacterota bacterium]